ncbi:MAG: M56 family metallopeptidase, partial [Saprospiraceae bacterium]|nr:M56 family metallopeptidase [Saprospiraceae bacterium]
MNWLINLFDPIVVTALGKMILHSLWQGSLIAFLLYIVLKLIPEKFAHFRHELSALALFLVFVSALSTFLTNLHTPILSLSSSAEEIIWLSAPLQNTYLQKDLTIYTTVIIWFLGFLILGSRLIVNYFKLYHIRKNSTRIVQYQIVSMIKRLSLQLGVKKGVAAVESSMTKIPGTIGYLKPIILMPISSATQLTPDQLEAILAHELAHIKRSDFLLNLIYTFIETIFYYHPAVWWIADQLEHERECDCDDMA